MARPTGTRAKVTARECTTWATTRGSAGHHTSHPGRCSTTPLTCRISHQIGKVRKGSPQKEVAGDDRAEHRQRQLEQQVGSMPASRRDRSGPPGPGRSGPAAGAAAAAARPAAPSRWPARRRWAAPSRRAPSRDRSSSGSPSSMPAKLSDIPRLRVTATTMNTKPGMASSSPRTAYSTCRPVSRVNGARSSPRMVRRNQIRSCGAGVGARQVREESRRCRARQGQARMALLGGPAGRSPGLCCP